MELPATIQEKQWSAFTPADPSLYGAIVEQIEKLEKQGIAVEIVPGVSSLFAAACWLLGTQLRFGECLKHLL